MLKLIFDRKKSDAFALAILFIVALSLWIIAYQVPFAATLAIGGDVATHRREDDTPFLTGFHASEPQHSSTYEWWTLSPGYAYRWASIDATITLPGRGVALPFTASYDEILFHWGICKHWWAGTGIAKHRTAGIA